MEYNKGFHMKSRSRKNKGKRLQNWICEKLSYITGIPWGKDELIASREIGQNGCDVRLIGKAKELIPFSIEAKNQEKWKIPEYIEQAKSNMYEGTNWIVVCKKNRVDPIVIMDAETFFKLLKRNIELEKENEGLLEDYHFHRLV